MPLIMCRRTIMKKRGTERRETRKGKGKQKRREQDQKRKEPNK